jgi:hypothetical protein
MEAVEAMGELEEDFTTQFSEAVFSEKEVIPKAEFA